MSSTVVGTDLEARVAALEARAQIQELVAQYSRGVDRKDPALLRSLYTADGTDSHGEVYDGDAEGYVDLLEQSFDFIKVGAHYACNHLIELRLEDGEAWGELYALGYHHLPAGSGVTESLVGVRYLDHYRVEDGRWRFASRRVVFDFDLTRPVAGEFALTDPAADVSYTELVGGRFERRSPASIPTSGGTTC